MKRFFLATLALAGAHLSGWCQTARYENLVFEGAGIRGIAYSGVVKQLEERQILPDIKRVGGTSAGAITALMIALGYNSNELYDIISRTKFQHFNDGRFIFIGGASRMAHKFGWYRGRRFSDFVGRLIEAKTGNPDLTFQELKDRGQKELYVTATCMNRQKLLVLSADTYPKMKVRDAVRISMSIPLYFEAVFIDSAGKRYPKYRDGLDIVIDGGVIGNFPIFLFDSSYTDAHGQTMRIANPKTLGARIDTEEQIVRDSGDKLLAVAPIRNFREYMSAFYVLVIESLNRTALNEDDWKRTISVSSVGITPRIRHMSEAQKRSLLESGENGTKAYLRWHH